MTGSVMLSLACATIDVDAIVDAVRAVCAAPIHVRDETVRSTDFADAGTAERVKGALRRTAIELVIDAADTDRLIEAIAASRRRLPVGWVVLPVLDQGLLA